MDEIFSFPKPQQYVSQGPDPSADAYRGGWMGKLLARGLMGMIGGPSREDVMGPSVLQQQAQWSDQTRGLPVADRLKNLSPMAENLGMNAATTGRVFDFSSPGFRTAKIGDTEIQYSVSKHSPTEVNRIETPRELRGRGSARFAMQQMIDEAKQSGAKLALTTEPMDKGITKQGLEEFYRSLGFKKNSGPQKDFTTRASMILRPEE